METTTTTTFDTTAPMTGKVSPEVKKALLILSCILHLIGTCGGPLIIRLYFIHGGKSLWLSTLLQSVGFPFIVIALVILYFHRRATRRNDNNNTETTTFIYMRPRLFFTVAFIGSIVGLEGYLYSYGFAHLPVSTAALISASQPCFMAVFSYFIVKQKFTPYSINAVVLLTVGSAVLALHTSSDRPKGVSKKEYLIWFLMTIVSALLAGLLLPLLELSYTKAKQTITFTLVLEIQVVICFLAAIDCMVGMIVNNDFTVIAKEATEFDLGETKYYTILCVSALIWQCNFLGAIGIVFCASSLLSGILTAALLPVIEVLAVVFYKEKFQVEKVVALILSLWGFASYFYGEYKFMKKSKDKTLSSHTLHDLAKTNNASV